MSPDLHHLSGAYAVDALDRSERSAFEQHLHVCSACQVDVTELSVAAASIASTVEATPPPSLRTSVLAGIAQVRPLPPLLRDDVAEDAAAGGSSAPALADPAVPVGGEPAVVTTGAKVIPLFRRTTTWIAAAAAAAVLAVGGVAWHPWAPDASVVSAMQQVQQAADSTTVTKHEGQVTATVAYSRSLDRSAISMSGMPPTPQGKVLQLWYIGTDGARSAGFLTPGDDGTGSAVLDGSLTGAENVGVTVEPAGGSQQPTTQPIVVVGVA